MPTRTTDDADRWRKLLEVAQRLAQEHGRRAIPVRDAAQWLDEPNGPRIAANDIVVTWTVADAELVRHQLRDRLSPDRVFPAAPRWRENIPHPRNKR